MGSSEESAPDAALRILVTDAAPETRGHVLLVLAGGLTSATCAALRDQLSGLLAAGRCHLVIDLHQLDRVDSAGLGVLVAAARRAQHSGGCLHAATDASPALRALRRTGVHRLLQPAATVEAAVRACPASGGQR